MSSSSLLSIREVIIITHGNCCEGQVPEDSGFEDVSSNSDVPLWRDFHTHPVRGEQGAGQQPTVSQDGHPTLRTDRLKAHCPPAGGGCGPLQACAQPWMGSPRRAGAGAVTTSFRLASVEGWLLLRWVGGRGAHDPGAPFRSQLTSGAREGSQDGGLASAWDPPATLQVTSRVGRGPLGGQGQYVLLQGRETGQGKLTERAGVCLQMAEPRRAGAPRLSITSCLLHVHQPHAPQFFRPVGSASGLKISFHREGVLSSWAFSVPAKHPVLRLQQSP